MNSSNFRVTEDLHATKTNRFVNFIIDIVVYYMLSFVIGMLLGVLSVIGISAPLSLITESVIGGYVFSFGVFLLYFIIFEIFFQRTLGKYITKTKVVMEDGSAPKLTDVILRSLCRLIPFEVFSYLGDDSRGWHDSMSETYVVNVERLEAKEKSLVELELIGKTVEN